MEYQDLLYFLQHVGTDPSRLIFEDELTGIYNRRFLLNYFRYKVPWDSLEAQPLSLLMMDLDHFKQINDRFGHPTGDRVLMTLAALLRRRLRGTDTIGRYGGEEFGLIFEDLDEEATIQLLERLRQEFSEIEHHAAGGEVFRNTFSAGVARLEGELPQLDAWRASADGALYCAKARGRNLVVGASEPPCEMKGTTT